MLTVIIVGSVLMILSVGGMTYLTLSIKAPYNLWLDDERPAPEGWYWAKNAREALSYLLTYQVNEISMDHDLGICADCLKDKTQSCNHDGYWLLKEMADRDLGPKTKPEVHSMNPVGRERMVSFINRYFPEAPEVEE